MPDRRKPLALDTTMRNPGRMANYVSILRNYENQILTHDIIISIMADFINLRLYEPTAAVFGSYMKEYKNYYVADDLSAEAPVKVALYFDNWKNAEAGTSNHEELVYLLKNTLTKHGESGYDYGWEARFKTIVFFPNELGFIWVEKDREIKISDNGKLLSSQYINGKQIEGFSEDPEHTAYLTAFAKYQTNNPWRHNTINMNLLPLFLKTAKVLSSEYGFNGISRKELPFIITWPNNDYVQLAKILNDFREEVPYNNRTDENIFLYAMNNLDESTPPTLGKASDEFLKAKVKDYKIGKITGETPDDVMRKLRHTQIISLRGNGRYLDINKFEIAKSEKVIEKYSSNNSEIESDFQKYFEYMGTEDLSLSFKTEIISQEQQLEELDAKQKALKEFAQSMDWESLRKEIISASTTSKGYTTDIILKEIQKPTRLEFLASIIMQKALPNARVVPHYKADDEGIPYNPAGGERGDYVGTDIDVYQDRIHALLEPTVSRARSFQVEHEVPAISNHVIASAVQNKENGLYDAPFAIFLAGKIVRPDVGNIVAVYKVLNNVNIYPWEADDYTDFSISVNHLSDYAKIRPYAESVRI